VGGPRGSAQLPTDRREDPLPTGRTSGPAGSSTRVTRASWAARRRRVITGLGPPSGNASQGFNAGTVWRPLG